MNIEHVIVVPTGHILIVDGDLGKLECLSLGDYGKAVNLKCDAMGLTRDIEQVKHQTMLPLSEKWVVTISTQYGCSMMCAFCDVPRVGPGRNATYGDLAGQIQAAMSMHPEITSGKRLNVHFARMGEPTWNDNVLHFTQDLPDMFPLFHVHPVVSTMMPRKNERLDWYVHEWMDIKNTLLGGEAGLQLSINSTNEDERWKMFSGSALPLSDISAMTHDMRPKGRKITLNFAVAGYEVDAKLLARLFDPEYFIVKLTPMHKTARAIERGIRTGGDYTTFEPYRDIEDELKAEGFDVLVFIASEAEDMGRITCGNAILSGTMPEIVTA